MFDLGALTFHDIAPFIAVGFAAQLVDGALGMAFGVISQTLLVSVLGLPPATASASVHVVEMFTTAASGASHMWHRNIDWGLFRRLVPYGVIGGVTGAYVLSSVDASAARPFVMLYLAGIGVYLLVKALRYRQRMLKDPKVAPKVIRPLAVAGGFLDAAGGGGWGPVVTSNLLAQGSDPRKTIGTVNSAEFVITTAISAAFIASIGLAAFGAATLGLIIGGVAAAPLGAFLVKRVQPRILLLAVSVLLILVSAFSIWQAWPFF